MFCIWTWNWHCHCFRFNGSNKCVMVSHFCFNSHFPNTHHGLPWWLGDKESACQCSRSLGKEYPLEKEIAIHCSILAWEIPWTKEADGLQSMGSQRIRHNLVTKQNNDKWYWAFVHKFMNYLYVFTWPVHIFLSIFQLGNLFSYY